MAPSTRKKNAKAPASRDLISTGPKQVFADATKSKRKEAVQKPTTARALILRNAARGNGEIVQSAAKLIGREKLDLLAEDLVQKSRSSVMTPFNLEKALKIAESQFSSCIDDIANLKDPELFSTLVEAEIKSRKVPDPKDPTSSWMHNPSLIASTVADRIHNTYLLGAAWKIVADTLIELQQAGLQDGSKTVGHLKSDSTLRSLYLVLYDIVNVIVNVTQDKFSVLATSTPHYTKYFKSRTNELGESEMTFDSEELRDACRSFLDSIVIELCFPRGEYPKAVLLNILHDAVDESPTDAKRFPQGLWDAVGDLSVVVELQQLLEAPLLTPDATAWKDEPRKMPPDYEHWVDAQPFSLAAAEHCASFKDLIYPLSKTREKGVLDNMWKIINQNYKNKSGGDDIDTLWGLEDAVKKPTPQWRTFVLPGLNLDSDDEGDGPRKITGRTKTLAITQGEDSDSEGGMPPLQDVSDSDSEYSESTDDDDDEEEEGDNDESDYDTDQEDDLRDLLRDAMDTAHAADWFNPEAHPSPEDDPLLEERKGNPFLKLLGSLRGRMFNKSTKLKTTAPGATPVGVKRPAGVKPAPSKAKTEDQPKSHKTTLEEVEDEDDVGATQKKKKKKPKKKKKKTATAAPGETGETAEAETAPSPVLEPRTAAIPEPASPPPSKAAPQLTPASPSKKKPTPVMKPTSPAKPAGVAATAPFMSTASLVTEQTTAQSGRSYVQSEHLNVSKQKIKKRAGHASIFPLAKGVLGKWGMGKDKQDIPEEKPATRRNWFSHLNMKTKKYLHQLLKTSEDDTRGSAGMKWEVFVKLMTDMGFSYDPSTAGSSVRFDPPVSDLRSISFHKPHPDTTITPIKLKEWSKKLQSYYGWRPEDVV